MSQGEKRVDKYSFNLKDKIGEGSYGQVYKGRMDNSSNNIAIKVLSKALINSDEYLHETLFNEIKVMQKLQGPHVVRLLDVLETQNNYYIIQEFCDGGDLQGHLKRVGRLSEDNYMRFFREILLGFMELVKYGIIHRDLKPANILINQGSYKIADFGFAKCVNNFSKDMLTTAVGTPLYMSPQILENSEYTSKCDVWSMGFIFYETIFGRTPWTARSIPELIQNVQNTPLNFPKEIQISDGIKNLLQGCLKIKEHERFSWDQIFRHQVFGTAFKQYLDHNKQLEEKANYLINDLRVTVSKQRLDLTQLFKELNLKQNQKLNMVEFSKLLERIDKNLTREEKEYIFNKLDEDGSNSIEFNEFEKWLKENDVQMTGHNPKPQQRQQSFKIDPQHQQIVQNNQQQTSMGRSIADQRSLQIINKLKLAIKTYNINLVDLFNKYDKRETHTLDRQELGVMLRRIDQNMMDHEIDKVFKYFDADGGGDLSFNEFQEVLGDVNQSNSFANSQGSSTNNQYQYPSQSYGQPQQPNASQGYPQQPQYHQYHQPQIYQNQPNQNYPYQQQQGYNQQYPLQGSYPQYPNYQNQMNQYPNNSQGPNKRG